MNEDTKSAALDWSKPIQFADGELLELLETKPDGTRVVLRPDALGMTSVWVVPADGKCRPGTIGNRLNKHVVNRP